MYRLQFARCHPLCCLALLLSHTIVSAQADPIYCSANNYGSPTLEDCYSNLISIVIDSTHRFFVEQQLRISPPADWPPFTDPRPASEREPIAQLPKWWSYSGCNAALVSYGNLQQYTGVSLITWLDVHVRATQIVKNCLIDNGQGGAGILYNPDGNPGLTLYVWADGSLFDNVMNDYMNSDFPKGLNPASMQRMLGNNASSVPGLRITNATSLTDTS